MISAYQNSVGGWTANYTDRDGFWRVATDARQYPLSCATKTLALSVARYRRRRLKIWR